MGCGNEKIADRSTGVTIVELEVLNNANGRLILVPIKEIFTNEAKPFPNFHSFLITREVLQYLGLHETLDFLRKGSH